MIVFQLSYKLQVYSTLPVPGLTNKIYMDEKGFSMDMCIKQLQCPHM